LVNQITMPEVGAHSSQPQNDGTTLVAPNVLGQGFNVPVNIGRAVTSTWNNDAGFWWYEQFQRAGSYYDKVMSLEAFSDPDLYLLNRTSSGDVRQYEVGFYQMFPEQTLRFYGGLLAEDNQDFAPIVDTRTSGNPIARTHLATINLPMGTGANQNGRLIDASHVPIDPQDHFTIQLWAVSNALAMIPTSFDQSFTSYTALWLDGTADARVVQNPDVNTVTFVNPWTHETYRALHFGTAAGEPGAAVGASALIHASTGAVATEAGIAARMLLHVRDLDAERTQAIASGNTTRANAIEQAERQYLNVLDTVRYFTHQYGNGSIWIPPQNSI
jgi:hypothetical protein